MNTWIIIISIFFLALGILCAWVYIPLNRDRKKAQFRKMKLNDRPKLSKKKYINHFNEKGYKIEHIELVYNEIKGFCKIGESIMYPEDDLYKDYAVDSFDMEEIELIDIITKKQFNKTAKQEDLDKVSETTKYFNAESLLNLLKLMENKSQLYE